MAGKNKVGRPNYPSKMADAKDPIVELIEKGIPVKTACEAVGIVEPTFYGWINKGKAAKAGQYREFYLAIKKAKAQAIAKKVEVIHDATSTSWQAAAWWLERRCPAEFGRKEQIKHEGSVGTAVANVLIYIPDNGRDNEILINGDDEQNH